VKINVASETEMEHSVGRYGVLRMFKPVMARVSSSKNVATLHFSRDDVENEKDEILFVDLMATLLSGRENDEYRPRKTGLHCAMNAIWGEGGRSWLARDKIQAVVDGIAVRTSVDRSKRVFSFRLNARERKNAYGYFLINTNTGEYGPTMLVDNNCQELEKSGRDER
jgi:hypothetical protein